MCAVPDAAVDLEREMSATDEVLKGLKWMVGQRLAEGSGSRFTALKETMAP